MLASPATAWATANSEATEAAEARDSMVASLGESIRATKLSDESGLSDSAGALLPAALKGETEIEQLTSAYQDALRESRDIEKKVGKLQAEVDKLKAALPAQEARSDEAVKQRYIMQSHQLAIVDSLLSSQTLSDFFRQTEYLERISRSCLAELNRTVETKEKLDKTIAKQKDLRDEAQVKVEQAQVKLHAAQAERSERQGKAQANSRQQAETIGGEASIGVAADGGEQPEDYREAASTDVDVLVDDVDWFADRDAFIEEWAERIDAYLEGSPLEGQGVNFAASAWKYCVDPRWSPAISNTESSKGTFCIKPHNAWGWGAADEDPEGLALEWDSWEEAIDAHIAGLAEGYGYTISMTGAQTYCPITWQSWYNHTTEQMAQI